MKNTVKIDWKLAKAEYSAARLSVDSNDCYDVLDAVPRGHKALVAAYMAIAARERILTSSCGRYAKLVGEAVFRRTVREEEKKQPKQPSLKERLRERLAKVVLETLKMCGYRTPCSVWVNNDFSLSMSTTEEEPRVLEQRRWRTYHKRRAWWAVSAELFLAVQRGWLTWRNEDRIVTVGGKRRMVIGRKDGRIYYLDQGRGYSWRVKTITASEAVCAE